MKQTIQIDIDYTQALLWFDHAMQMKDPYDIRPSFYSRRARSVAEQSKKGQREESSTRSSTISHTNCMGLALTHLLCCLSLRVAHEQLDSHARATLHVCTQVNAEIMKALKLLWRRSQPCSHPSTTMATTEYMMARPWRRPKRHREFVAEAEAGLEAGIALARAENERDEIRKDSLKSVIYNFFLSHLDFLSFFVSFLHFFHFSF